MVEVISGISITIALGFIVLYIKDFVRINSTQQIHENEDDGFCEIDMDYVAMYADDNRSKDVSELKKKLEAFKNRNRFYKM